ncbi:hypothetical protein AMCSP13_001064 [Streptococcus pneumoniae 2070335]|nr:hypothetical protein AMCSP13_001064 [Streptococcus pneumoniae 2070335]
MTENLTNVQVLQKMDDTDHRIRNNIAHYLENYSIVSFYEK